MQISENQLRVAFDGDAVLFSDESEQIVKAHGLDKFFEHEKTYENKPLAQVLLRWSMEIRRLGVENVAVAPQGQLYS